jgi:hypothetical protein
MTEDADRTRREGLAELAEDTVGFGGQELRLTRDLVLRPGAVMDAYDAHGPTAGGIYPKPLRYWLTINGLFLLLSAISGAMDRTFGDASTSGRGLELMAARAGKSVDEFRADVEQWMSLFSLPIYALIFGGMLFLLFRRWSPGADRQDFRQTFTYLNAYTVWVLPFSCASFLLPTKIMLVITIPLTLVIMAILFALLGRGRWWRTRAGAWGKGALLMVAALLAVVPYSLISSLLVFSAAIFLP